VITQPHCFPDPFGNPEALPLEDIFGEGCMQVCVFVNVKELHNLYTACTILILLKSSQKGFKKIVRLVCLAL